MAGGRGVADTALEDGAGGGGEAGDGIGAGGRHGEKDLEEAPALAVVALCGEGAFAFEVDVVDESEEAGAGGLEALEIAADEIGLGGWEAIEHPREGGAHAIGKEAGLEGEGGGEECAELAHAGCILRGLEGCAGWPGAGAAYPIRDGDAAGSEVGGEPGEALLEGAALAGWIPDEMADAEGGELFALVP